MSTASAFNHLLVGSIMRFSSRRCPLALIGSLALLLADTSFAQESWPSRSIRLIVHTTPGSSSDQTARMVAAELGKKLGQGVVVENRAGAGGAIGAEAAAKAVPDGYTLLAGASSVMVTAPALSARKLAYDPDEDFIPIGRVSVVPYLLVVNADSKFGSVANIITKAKETPGKVSYATAGVGTNNHLLGELMNAAAGISLLHVPYRGPSAAQVDLLGGVVDLQFDTQSSVAQLIKTGMLRAIATSGAVRPPGLPDVPTFTELGYPQLQLQGWNAVYALRGTPAYIVKRLQDELTSIQALPDMKARLADMGQVPDNLIGVALLEEQRRSRESLRKFASSKGIALE
jgi:tripartite-type tricarboxylate transporter receptor subunit TctC